MVNRPTEKTVLMILEIQEKFNIKNTNLTKRELEILEIEKTLIKNDSYSLDNISSIINKDVKYIKRIIKKIDAKLLIEYLRENI